MESAQILFECKFTEPDGGPCSQKDALKSGEHAGVIQCDGNYKLQQNPVNKRSDRCALSGKGIRYWEVVPQVFQYKADACHEPCPFAGPWFQWMRNLTVAYETGRVAKRKPAFVVAYADALGLPMADQIRSDGWQRFCNTLVTGAVPLKTLSMQRIAAVAVDAVASTSMDTDKWCDLAKWIEHRISDVARERART